MKRVYELDVYRLAEALSDMVWHDIQEVHLKKPNHGCENSSEEKFVAVHGLKLEIGK